MITEKCTRKLLLVLFMAILLLTALTVSGCSRNKDDSSDNGVPSQTDEIAGDATTQPEINPTEAPGSADPAFPSIAYCNAKGVHVRTAPVIGDAVGGLDHGEIVEVIGREGDWYELKPHPNWGGGVQVYVSAQYIQFTVPEPTEPESSASTESESASTESQVQ